MCGKRSALHNARREWFPYRSRYLWQRIPTVVEVTVVKHNSWISDDPIQLGLEAHSQPRPLYFRNFTRDFMVLECYTVVPLLHCSDFTCVSEMRALCLPLELLVRVVRGDLFHV